MHNITITDVRAVPGDSAFLIDDGQTAILYDSGFAFTGYKVADKIKEVLGDRTLNFIFLTHSHYDHALGSVYVKKRFPDAKIVAGEYAAKIFAKPSARAVMRDLDKKVATENNIIDYEDLIDEICADITVNDGDEILAGSMRFVAVAFPGHTRCSVGFYLPENKLLLGAETLGVYGGENLVVPSYLIGYGVTMESIAKAQKMDIQSILIPHTGLLNKEQTACYLKNSLIGAKETAHEIAQILRDGGSEQDAIDFFADKYYNEYVREIYPVDAMQLNTSIMVNLIARELLDRD